MKYQQTLKLIYVYIGKFSQFFPNALKHLSLVLFGLNFWVMAFQIIYLNILNYWVCLLVCYSAREIFFFS